MSLYDHLGSVELETLKQDLRKQRADMECKISDFTKRIKSGTGGTRRRIPRFDKLTKRQSELFAEYERLGNAAMEIQQVQSLRKEERAVLYKAENGKFDRNREFVKLARRKLSAQDIEEIEDMLDMIADSKEGY